MNSAHASAPHTGHYYVPQPSLYPFFLSGGMFLLALGFILQMNRFAPGPWVMAAGAGVIGFVLYRWFGAVIAENQRGDYTGWEDQSFRQGMVWFIGSEVMFFAAFFAALFYCRHISVPALAGMDPAFTLYKDFTAAWPSAGPKGASFTPMGAWGIPAINTALLLTSGVTLTIAHHALKANARGQVLAGAVVTEGIRPGVICLHEGAWPDIDPQAGICKNGAVNVLTKDIPTSRLGNGCAGNTALAWLEKYDGPALTLTAFDPPANA